MQEIDRSRRVGELIKRELGTLIGTDLNDPRVRLVSVTAVKVTKDLKQADVYVSQLSDKLTKVDSQLAIKGLTHAASYLRRQLGSRLNLRHTPALKFHYDSTILYGMEMTDLISKAVGKNRPVQ